MSFKTTTKQLNNLKNRQKKLQIKKYLIKFEKLKQDCILKIREIEKDKKRIQESLSELEDEISAINIDYNHNNTLLEEENKNFHH